MEEQQDAPLDKQINEMNIKNDIEEHTDQPNEPVKKKRGRKAVEKLQFHGICNKCVKVFKNERLYTEHTKYQKCTTADTTTYCKICDLTLDNRNDYEKHLVSLTHIEKIQANFGHVEPIEINETPAINIADPYLTSEDITNITKKTLGHNFTINFKNNRSQTVNLVALPKVKKQNINDNIPDPNNQTNNTQHTNNTHNIQNTQHTQHTQNNQNTQHNISNQPVTQNTMQQQIRIVEPTQRQKKIITFLEGILDVAKCSNKLMELLDNKLHIDDYKNLQSLIKQSTIITDQMKEIYITTIEKFTMALVKLKTKGITLYKDKDIATLVMNLTS